MEEIRHSYYEDRVYYTQEDNGELGAFLRKSAEGVLSASGAVGVIGGSYDRELHVDYISQFALDVMDDTYENFGRRAQGGLADVLYPEDRSVFEAHAGEDGSAGEREYRLLNREGEPVWCREVRQDYEWEGQKKWLIAIRPVDDLFQTASLNQQMLMSLTHIYREIYTVNFQSGTYRMLHPFQEKPMTGKYTSGFFDDWQNDVIHPEDLEQIRNFLEPENVQKALMERDAVEQRYRKYVGGGAYEWRLACFTVGQRVGGKVVNATLAIRSIQDMVLAEENSKSFLLEAMEDAKAANEAKNIFLSRMSHDLRTPINGILGMTELAQVDLDDRVRVQECLEKVQISGNYLLMLVNELLDFSKLESSQMAMEEHPFDLLDSIGDCLEMVRAQREQKEQILHIKGFHVEHTKVLGDNLRLQQLVTNIVGNCVKYTPRRGTIQIELREKENSQPGLGRYCITVQDNGIGMSEDFLQHIFEPFTRVEDERTSKTSGTGLGMAIAYHIAHKMGGNIRVYSKEDEGSTFVIDFYLKLRDLQNEAGKAVFKPSGEEQSCNYADYRVLLVEDNDINRELAVNVLRLTGVEVDAAIDGKEAVDKFMDSPERHYDMIFMDIQMPVMDGYEATRRIRSSGREDSDLPIVALTANAFADDVVASMEAGMNEHIAKPLKIKMLHQTMGKWLMQKPTRKNAGR